MHDISRLRVSDDGDCAAAHTVITAARSHHRPWHESPSVAELTRSLRYTLPGERLLAWLARDDDGQPVGLASVWLPDDDNTDKAWLELDVLPRARRQGVGSALLQTLLDAAVEEGRTEAVLETTAYLPGGVLDPAPAPEPADRKHPQDFFGRCGFTVQVRETVRHLELPVPPEVLDRLDPAAGGGIPGYRLVSSAGPIPSALRASYCDLANRLIVDAPSGDIEWQPDTLTPAKLAAHEQADDGIGRTRVTTLAVHEQTGQVVAYTQLLLQGTTTRSVIQEAPSCTATTAAIGSGWP